MSNEYIREKREASAEEIDISINYIDNKILFINNQIMYYQPNSPELKHLKKELIQVLTIKQQILKEFLEKYQEKKKIEKVI
jgi:hypothetical protein